MSRSRSGGVVLGVLLLCLCSSVGGLNADGLLLLSFKYAVTADPLSALADWSYADDSPCSWNGVMCMGFAQPTTAFNLSSSTEGSTIITTGGSSNNSGGLAGGSGVNASLAAATVSRVISLVLPKVQLSGSLPADIGLIEHLRHLDLSGNSLNGSIPATLFNASELRVLSLAGNDISGELPDLPAGNTSSVYVHNLQSLNLSDNALAGRLPAGLCRLPNLSFLGLANNYLSGELPPGGFSALEVLDISANLFNGSLPSDFGGNRLRFLNASSNRLTGAIPTELSSRIPANATVDLSSNNFTGAIPQAGPFAVQQPEAYAGNPELCGPPLKQMCSIPSSLSNPPNATESPPAFAAIPRNPGRSPPGAEGQAPQRQEKLRPAAILAIAAGDLAFIGLLFMVFLYVYHIKKKRRHQQQQEQQQQQKASRGIGGVKTVEIGGKEDKASTSMACCIGGKNESSDTSDSSASSETEAEDGEELKKKGFLGGSSQEHGKKQQQAAAAPATLVTVDGDGELEMETLLKASAYILGATGSSIVYKAVLADGTALAVRRIGESGGIDKLKDFEAQVRAVARFRHPNILRLRGFYWGADEKLLIHDYAPSGSLASIAFSKRLGTSSPLHLSLEARLRIARGVARGLAYLHEKKCVHGNVKPSNILLSADLEPWIGDFGLDRLLSGEATYRTGASARLFGSKRSMHSTSSLPDLSQMPGAGASPCGSASASSTVAPPPYQAPECLKNLRPNAKWDVYSFGMVLLELLSGRVYSEVELCQWHAGFVVEEKSRALRMTDPALRGEAEGKEDKLLRFFKLAFACCAMAPQKRPVMREALQVLERMPATASATP